MIYQKLLSFCAIIVLIAMLPNMANAANPQNGQSLFLEKCASCHNNDMKTDMTGPALLGVQDRWKKYPKDIYRWIRNSSGLIEENQPYAKAIYAKWNNSQMSPFPELDDAAIDDILSYIQNKGELGCATPPCETQVAATGGASGTAAGEENNPYLAWGLIFVLLFAVAMLGRYINSLNRLSQERAGENVEPAKSIVGVLLSPLVVKILVFVLVLVGGYTTVNKAIGLGRQQGYAPSQPIKFSHKLHAGKHGIDCQYCHDGARRSKHSVIPATNTCINCHANVQKGPEHGTAEILKVYAASGFNPVANQNPYENYLPADLDAETRTRVYRSWLKKMMKDDLKKDEKGTKRLIETQLASIQTMFNKPVEWVRIHNLPDHVYFNHAQHVSVGKIKCQTCHGKVEEMDIVKQHAPLSMGWCINCHRQTEVQFRDGLDKGKRSPYEGEGNQANAYYSEDYKYYEKYHEELKAGDRKGVTVEEIGGLECQKCHY